MVQVPDWSKANLELVQEALRQGELRLQAQVQLATSADQRATILAGIYGVAATGVMAAPFMAPPSYNIRVLIAGALATATAFLIGSLFCIWATLPVKFWSPGNDPEQWWDDIAQNKKPEAALGEQAAYFNAHIIQNRKSIEDNAWRFKIGALAGVSAPFLGLFVAGVTWL